MLKSHYAIPLNMDNFEVFNQITKAMLLYNSAICDLLRESIQIMKIPIHVKVVILVSEK